MAKLLVGCLLAIGASADPEVPASNTSSGCCWCQGKCCNPSPFANDPRCVCGPKSSDWKTPQQCGAPKQCPRTAAGQRSIYDPHCSGTGCGAPYNDPDCAFCVYDMTACTNVYGDACWATYNARKAEGIIGCGSPSFPLTKQCPRTAAGQRSIYDPHCSGTGCGKPYNDPDCAFCVYDMTACMKKYGDACIDTYKAREAEGIIGCPSASSLAVEAVKSETNSSSGCCWCQGKCCNPSPFANDPRCVCGPKSSDWKTPQQCGAPKQCPRTAAGQRSIYDPHCSGTGCGAPYNDPDCAFCVYDMTACKKAYGGACMDTYNARKAEGIIGCPSDAVRSILI